MPRADYWGAVKEIQHIIQSQFNDLTVRIEEDMQFAAEQTPWVCVYLDSREVPDDQPLAAGRVTRLRVRFSIWVWCFNMELAAAVKARDEWVGDIESALLANRTLNDRLDGLWIEGGELPSAKDPDTPGFFSGGEILIASDLRTEV